MVIIPSLFAMTPGCSHLLDSWKLSLEMLFSQKRCWAQSDTLCKADGTSQKNSTAATKAHFLLGDFCYWAMLPSGDFTPQ